MRFLRVACVALLATGALAVPSDAATRNYHPGAASANDSLVPGLGNGGYTVSHYDIRLTWHPSTGRLIGKTVITARLTQNLSRFDLDFALPARSVHVDGHAATFASVDGPDFSASRDLVVTPAHGLNKGHRATVVVTYDARPGRVRLDGFTDWTRTPTGIMVWDEPTAAAQWWYPGNDYPSDKATYDIRVTAPRNLRATANGVQVSRHVDGKTAVTHWRVDAPMASYLSLLTIGRYTVHHAKFGSVPVTYTYEDGLGALTRRARRDLSRTPQVLRFLQARFGRYPFDAAGGVVVGFPFASALETQTHPVYESGLWQNDADELWAVVHENSHQWFGDSVSMRHWKDIWLAEGFATYAEWIWSQAHHEGTAEQLFRTIYREHPRGDDLWSTPLNGPFFALSNSVYERGAMLLQALHNRVGGKKFDDIMRAWAQHHRHANGSTAGFEALARRISGRKLTGFFHAWVEVAKRPAATRANGFPPDKTNAAAARPRSLVAIERSDALLAAGSR